MQRCGSRAVRRCCGSNRGPCRVNERGWLIVPPPQIIIFLQQAGMVGGDEPI